jgi:hypothetical protein
VFSRCLVKMVNSWVSAKAFCNSYAEPDAAEVSSAYASAFTPGTSISIACANAETSRFKKNHTQRASLHNAVGGSEWLANTGSATKMLSQMLEPHQYGKCIGRARKGKRQLKTKRNHTCHISLSVASPKLDFMEIGSVIERRAS